MAFTRGLHLGRELHAKLYHDTQLQCSTALESIDHVARGLLEDAFWAQADIYPPLFRKTQISPAHEDYSLTLHLATLALGMRHADRRRTELAPFWTGTRESSLHCLLRTVIDTQISVADTVDVLQAVVILSNLEYSCGRYLSATTYLHYAFARISNPTNDMVSVELCQSDDDLLLRRALIRVCRFLHMQWMSFHPTNLPGLHLPPTAIAQALRNSETGHAWVKYDGDNDNFSIYHALLELLSIIPSTTQMSTLSTDTSCKNVYAQLCKVETTLIHFRRTIPARFQWNGDTWRTASVPMFLLHLQLCVASVLLYGRLAQAAKSNCTSELSASPDEVLDRCYAKVKRGSSKLACSVPRFFERYDSSYAPGTMVTQLGVAVNALLDAHGAFGVKGKTAVLPALKCCVVALETLSERHQLAEDLASLATKHLASFWCVTDGASKSPVPGLEGNNVPTEEDPGAQQPANGQRLPGSGPRAEAARPAIRIASTQKGSSVSRKRSAEHPESGEWIRHAAVIEDPIFPAYSREMSVLFSMYREEKKHKSVGSSLQFDSDWLTHSTRDRHRSISQQDVSEQAASLTTMASDSTSSLSPPNPIECQGSTPGNDPALSGTEDIVDYLLDMGVPHDFDIDGFCSALNGYGCNQTMDWAPDCDLESWINLPVPDMLGPA
ncbi:hypothetical protein ABEF95_004050 [Exophiala dermatitidis]